MCHKKRKEASAPLTQACVGTHDVIINPRSAGALNQLPLHQEHHPLNGVGDGDGAGSREPVVTIPTHTFGGTNGHQVKSFLLLFKVELVHDQENVCEPASKRRRLSRGGSCVATVGGDSNDANTHSNNNNNNVANGPAGPTDGGGSADGGGGSVSCYRAELVVYDRHGRCQLTPGTYDLLLQPMNGSGPAVNMGRVVGNSPRKSASWETAEDLKVEAANFKNFQSSNPTLQFRLSWTHEAGGGPLSSGMSSTPNVSSNTRTPISGSLLRPVIRPKQPLSIILTNDNATKPKPQGVCSPEAPQLVLYQFVYNNNGRQQTEARRDFHCPWCSINCLALYCLLKHLKLCHARFTFTYVPHPKGARIDVALNDCYDGSYAGNPQDLVWLSGGNGGALFSRAGPARRAPTTALLVCRPHRSKPSLSEFLEQDNADFDLPRSYILGHNRLYHHTMSCRPIGAHELDEDSEGEHDSRWMRSKTVTMIDDFSDVNEGEKEIMKLWNVHVMKYNFVGDCQLAKSCALFVEAHGEELLSRNLYRNYVLHLVSLYEFGVMGAGAVYNNIRQLQDLMKEKPELKDAMSSHWNNQRKVAPRAFTSPRSSIKVPNTGKAPSAGAGVTPSPVVKALFSSASCTGGTTLSDRTVAAAAGRSSSAAAPSTSRNSSVSNVTAKSNSATISNSSKNVSSAAAAVAAGTSYKMSASCSSSNSPSTNSSSNGLSASNSRSQNSVPSTPTSKSNTLSSSANNPSIKTSNSTNATNVARSNTPRSSSSSGNNSSSTPKTSIPQVSSASSSQLSVNITPVSKNVLTPNVVSKTGNSSKMTSSSSKSSNPVSRTQSLTPKTHHSSKSSVAPSSVMPKSQSAAGKSNTHNSSNSGSTALSNKSTLGNTNNNSTLSGIKNSQNSNSSNTVKSSGAGSSFSSSSSGGSGAAKNGNVTSKTTSFLASSNPSSVSAKSNAALSSPALRTHASNTGAASASASDVGGSKPSVSKAK